MIRKAQMEDYEQIEKIMLQVHRMHVTWRPDVYCDTEAVFSKSYFEELLNNDEILLYEEQNKVVGIAFYKDRIIHKDGVQVAKKTLFVDVIAVLEGYRGKGIGHALFDALKDIAKSKNFEGIELQVNAKNENAIKMYKGYGFTAKSINMETYF